MTGRPEAGRGVAVLYEDDDVLAVDKPEGIPVIPGPAGATSLRELVQDVYHSRVFVVHRLDKDVSGVLLFAKNPGTHRALNAQFAAHAAAKTYLALVHGVLRDEAGEIDLPLRAFGSGRMGVDARGGKGSLTRFAVAERLPRFTLVEVSPVTGRRHQIRVHLYAVGHPVVGDPLYGDRREQRLFPRLMLHARRLRFDLPSGGARTVEAPVPASFASVVEAARRS